jgi:hypothetical protein
MNWLHFLLWILGIYFLYYLVIIIYDKAVGGRSTDGKPLTNELTFAETAQPQKLEHGPETDAGKNTKAGVNGAATGLKYEPEMIASGGVSLRDLFSLARQEAIVYTGQVSY